MFYIVALQAAASIMRTVDRPPTNLKRLIIESSQESFSVDIPRSIDIGDPTNTRCDGDPPQHRKRGVAADAKKIPMPSVDDDDDDFEPPKKKCNIKMDAPNKTQVSLQHCRNLSFPIFYSCIQSQCIPYVF
jgi:hypothetical protein